MKDYKCFLVVAAIIGTLILHFAIYNSKEGIAPIIYFLTLLAIIWYSKETQELKEISIKRPCLSFNRGNKIVLKNYGEGVARDIEIKISDKVVHKIPLVSSPYSKHSGELSFSDEENSQLEKYKGEIVLHYYDISGKTKYFTIIQWDDSENNRDGCKIIDYRWE